MSPIFFIAVQNNFYDFHRLSWLLTILVDFVRRWHLCTWWKSISSASQHNGHTGGPCSIKMDSVFFPPKNFVPTLQCVLHHVPVCRDLVTDRTENPKFCSILYFSFFFSFVWLRISSLSFLFPSSFPSCFCLNFLLILQYPNLHGSAKCFHGLITPFVGSARSY